MVVDADRVTIDLMKAADAPSRSGGNSPSDFDESFMNMPHGSYASSAEASFAGQDWGISNREKPEGLPKYFVPVLTQPFMLTLILEPSPRNVVPSEKPCQSHKPEDKSKG
jgi:hypothetical protein